MGAQAVAITGPDELDAALAVASAHPIALVVGAAVPAWMAAAVTEVRAAGRPLVVEVVDPADDGEVRAGREVGLVTALLLAGVEPGEIAGIAPPRVGRVAEVVRRWRAGGDA